MTRFDQKLVTAAIGLTAAFLHISACIEPGHDAAPPAAVPSATIWVGDDHGATPALPSASAVPPAPAAPSGSAEAPVAVQTDADLIVVARLVDRGARAPDCGGAHISVVMRYEVLRVVQGHYSGRTLYAVVGCPELPRAGYTRGAGTLGRFDVGAIHRLRLRDVPPPGGMLDKFSDAGLPRLWTVRADPDFGSR